MKVSVIVPLYSNRDQFRQFENGMWCLENQTYYDFEVIIVDDGSEIEWNTSDERFLYRRLRSSGVPPRSPNMAYLEGYDLASGDYIITSHPEILIAPGVIERMVEQSDYDLRNVPIQYHLSLDHLQDPSFTRIIYGQDFDRFKHFKDFWHTKTPWLYTNYDAKFYRHHFSFCGATRKTWMRYGEFLPATEEWQMEDCWWHEQETKDGKHPNPIDIEIYHQWHPRCYGDVQDETIASERIKRIRGL